jgi:hypothetical protein
VSGPRCSARRDATYRFVAVHRRAGIRSSLENGPGCRASRRKIGALRGIRGKGTTQRADPMGRTHGNVNGAQSIIAIKGCRCNIKICLRFSQAMYGNIQAARADFLSN